MDIVIRFDGDPIPWRAPFTTAKFSRTPAKQKKWLKAAQMSALVQNGGRKPLSGPVKLTMHIYMRIPVSRPKWWKTAAQAAQVYPNTRPDRTNIQKLAEDALVGTVIVDDNQVVDGRTLKLYTPAGERPGIVCVITPLPFLKSNPGGNAPGKGQLELGSGSVSPGPR